MLLQQQQNQIDEAIDKAQNENVSKQAEENNIRLNEFDVILQPIIESCTKDSISAGKIEKKNNLKFKWVRYKKNPSNAEQKKDYVSKIVL